MPVNLCDTQRIRGFQSESVNYNGSTVRDSRKRTKFQCDRCGAENVTIEPLGCRSDHDEPMGCCREGFLSSRLLVSIAPGAKHARSKISRFFPGGNGEKLYI